MIITETDGENGFNLHQKITENELKRRELLSENIKLLSTMKDKELFKAVLGDEKAQWSAYLGQIEVMYSRNDVYNMIRIQQEYIDKYKLEYKDIADIPKSRLIAMIPILEVHRIYDLLGEARVLTNQDFQNMIREYKGLPTMEDCQHKMQEYEVCSICGLKHKKECDESRQSISK